MNMRNLMNYVFYFAICSAFAVNIWFLVAELFAGGKGPDRKKGLAAAILIAAAFACCHFFYGGVQPRGGYDNDHDFGYQSVSFFKPGDIGLAMSSKEASPLVTDALSDAASGSSLRSVLYKNRLLMFLSAIVLFACLRGLDLGIGAAIFGSALFYLNFLTVLNGSAFSTTASNIFFLCSGLLAAVIFETRRRDLKGLIWALAAFFLIWTGRYELSFMPGLMLCLSLLLPGGALRALAVTPGARTLTRLALGTAAALCAAWTLLVLASGRFNGPSPGMAMQLLAHLKYQLGDKNLGVLAPRAAGFANYLAAAALAAAFLGARFSAKRGPRLVFWSVMLAWAVFVSAIFALPDSYALHFMRHHLYFFIPFVFIFSAAWDACWKFTGTRPAAVGLKWGALVCFCAVYLKANADVVRALEPEKRTNDMEWALLLKASENWPAGCAVMYPAQDKQHRSDLIRKYFPIVPDDCGRPAPACLLKYFPAAPQIMKAPASAEAASGGSAAAASARAGSRALYESVFKHRFYTLTDMETREEVPVRTGFYYADSPQDRARLMENDGLCLLKKNNFGGAERKFREAAALDPSCAACGTDLAAGLAFEGKKDEAARLIERELSGGAAGEERRLLSALQSAAAGNEDAAMTSLKDFLARNYGYHYSLRASAYLSVLSRRSNRN